MAREVGECDRTDIYCHCFACPDHCSHVCAEEAFQCCVAQAAMDASCPYCGERAEQCGCHESTHGG